MKKLLIVFAVLFSAHSCHAESTLVVSAAASLKNVLTAMARSYPDAIIKFNFASSGTLQRQIESGAPVDLFVSAAEKNMDELQSQKLIELKTRRVLAGNRLVLIVPKNSKVRVKTFADLKKPQVQRVAMGAPKSVPAGKYAQQVLEKIGIWKIVEKKAVRGKDVREVLTQVELGNVDAGIVYLTDARISKKVKVVSIASEKLHAPIRYSVAVVSASNKKNAAKKFAAYLRSTPAQAKLQRYGFIGAK